MRTIVSTPTIRWLLGLTLIVAPLSAEDMFFRRGDANASSEVDLSDAVHTLSYLFLGGPAAPCLDAADADDSGEIDVSDAIATLGFLFLGGQPLPPPGTRCGWDPTADSLGCREYRACDQPVRSFVVIDGYAVVEGDIIIGKPEDVPVRPAGAAGGGAAIAVNLSAARWPGGLVPYVLDSKLTSPSRATNAMTTWQTMTDGRVRFAPRKSEASYVRFVESGSADTCSSWVGMQGGEQVISVGKNCSTGNLLHEVGHGLGLFHEQNRCDRDSHVRIHLENASPSSYTDFQSNCGEGVDIGPYDFGSIMHYWANAFSTNGKPTIETMPPGMPIGQRIAPSDWDIAAIQEMYDGWHTPFSITPDGLWDTTADVAVVHRSPGTIDTFVLGPIGALWNAGWWSEGFNGDRWNPDYPITNAGIAPQGGHVAAVSRVATVMDVFFVGWDSYVYNVHWCDPLVCNPPEVQPPALPRQWTSPAWIESPGVYLTSAPPGAPLAAISRTADGIDVFAITSIGGLASAAGWVSGAQNWSSGYWIGSGGLAPPGGHLAAVSRVPYILDVFFAGNDGAVYQAHWYRDPTVWSPFGCQGPPCQGEWYEPVPISPPKFVLPGAPIAAVSRAPGDIDVFAVERNGAIYHAGSFRNEQWSTPGLITTQTLMSPVAHIAAAAPRPDTLHVFAVGTAGELRSTWKQDGVNGGQWNCPGCQTSPRVYAPGGSVAAISRKPGLVDVLGMGKDHAVWTQWLEE